MSTSVLRMDPLDALARVARATRADLVRAARREGASPEDAVDCAQEALCTFLKLAQRGEVPTDSAEWPPFLATVARNAARNKRRRHHLAKPHAGLDELDGASADVPQEAMLAAAEEHIRLRACVDRLCDTQRSVVTLRMLDEQPGEDVAAALGISRAHVDVLLHRAKKNLRACMLETEDAT